MTVATPPDLGRSWWLREALAIEGFAGPPAPPLDTDTTADVVILGGGYTGMWTAWFLKEREPSLDVVLLEADICGGGPSGRNGGFCDGWWSGVGDLIATYGEEAAKELLVTCGASPGEIGAWCQANGVDAWFRMGGDLAVASAPAHEGRWLGTIRAARSIGLGDGYHVLSASEVRERVRSPVFGGGMLIDDGANVQPARLARGLRRVLLERGVRIHEQTPVRRFGAGRPAVAETPFGTVSAEHAVIALGAWATPWKAFRGRLTVRGSYMAITEPAPDRLAELGWTGSESVRDLRSSVHYVRTTPDGRIAMGLGGIQPDLARRIDPRYAYDARSVRRVGEDLLRFFPSFRDVGFAGGWGGPIERVRAQHALLRHDGRRQRPPRPGVHGQRGRALAPRGEDPRRARDGCRRPPHSTRRRHPRLEAVPSRADPLAGDVRREQGDLREGRSGGRRADAGMGNALRGHPPP